MRCLVFIALLFLGDKLLESTIDAINKILGNTLDFFVLAIACIILVLAHVKKVERGTFIA
jgi:hypothetical protein